MNPILIHGAGGHAKVAYTVAIASRREVFGFLDPHSPHQTLFNLPVFKSNPYRSDAESLIAIGNNIIRQQLAEKELNAFATLVHPSAIIAPGVTLGPGTLVCAGAIIEADSTIGSHTIINSGATINHDCTIGNYVHIAPGATLCGGITVHDQALIGAGSTIIPNITVNKESTLAAGATLIEDLPPGETWGGVPARYLG